MSAVPKKGLSLPLAVVTDDEQESSCSASAKNSTPRNRPQATVPKKCLSLLVVAITDDEKESICSTSVASSLRSWPATPSNQAASLKQSSRPFDDNSAFPKRSLERSTIIVSDEECESTCSDSGACTSSNKTSQPQIERDSALISPCRGYDPISILERMFTISLSSDESETTESPASTKPLVGRNTNDSDPNSSASSSSSSYSSSYDDLSDDESSISLPRCPII